MSAAGNADDRMPELVRLAREAMSRAYAPYSGFRVGAVLLGEDGSVTLGCNVENAAYPSSICAERGAVMAAVAKGVQRFERLVLATESDDPTSPCGQCRQVLVEFAPALPIVSVTASGREQRWSMAELLPSPFIPTSLHSA
jgi:cytidine deaminase